jgi:Alginate lyase
MSLITRRRMIAASVLFPSFTAGLARLSRAASTDSIASRLDFPIWRLQEPVGPSPYDATVVPSALLPTYSDPYFYPTPDGWQAFMDPQTGATTGETALHPRTELRELNSKGTDAAWTWPGIHTMTVMARVTMLGGESKGQVSIGQIHTDSNPPSVLCLVEYWASAGGLVLIYNPGVGNQLVFNLDAPCSLNELFIFEILFACGVLAISVNGSNVFSGTPNQSFLDASTFFFKCGCYDQTAIQGPNSTAPYTIVDVYSIGVFHSPAI